MRIFPRLSKERSAGPPNHQAAEASTWVPPGHFYSPVVDPQNDFVKATLDSFEQLTLPSTESLSIPDELILETFERIASHYHELPFTAYKEKRFRYFYENSAFSYGDAVTYFGLLLEFRPRRVIEIGSGYSSCLLMDVNDLLFNSSIEAKFIEPYPELLKSLIGAEDFRRYAVRPMFLQEVPDAEFRELAPNDILFIDSSHVLKTGSDVNDYLFRILPILQPGVIVHIHDIPYPFEYGPDWIRKENRSWNEAYAVRAFLQYNRTFQILYFNHYMHKAHRDLLTRTPLVLRNCGASLWLRKTLL